MEERLLQVVMAEKGKEGEAYQKAFRSQLSFKYFEAAKDRLKALKAENEQWSFLEITNSTKVFRDKPAQNRGRQKSGRDGTKTQAGTERAAVQVPGAGPKALRLR